MATPLTTADVEIIEAQTVYQGYFRIDRYRLRHRLHDGGWGAEITRELFERGQAVAILLYDPDADALVLIEQFRIGALTVGWQPWLIEVVAGIIDPGESVEQVARREVREEAGCEVLDLVPIHSYLVSPGGTSETVSVYCGWVDSRGVSGIHGLIEEGEDIRVLVIPAFEALAMLERDELRNSATLVAMLWFALNRDKLRQQWGGKR
ncbi:MAG: NUDIX domain-containing protein [Alphaproteobacteria bacterium]|nr:NUDIX domain-containing protein [Alphaproteobacteria bacterium]